MHLDMLFVFLNADCGLQPAVDCESTIFVRVRGRDIMKGRQ